MSKITDEQIDRIFDHLPGGLQGFARAWGYRDFARRVLALRAIPQWEPEFDAISPTQEELAMKFAHEACESGVDSVRLLEMAEQLYKAERNDKLGMEIIE